MPLPLAAAPPLVAAPLFGPAAVGAAKVFALECIPAASSLSAAAILARIVFNQIPEWIKNDITFSGVRKNDKVDGLTQNCADELECLSSVLEKLYALAESTNQHHEYNAPIPHLYASLMAYVQVVAQYKRLLPQEGIKRYHEAGHPYGITLLPCADVQAISFLKMDEGVCTALEKGYHVQRRLQFAGEDKSCAVTKVEEAEEAGTKDAEKAEHSATECVEGERERYLVVEEELRNAAEEEPCNSEEGKPFIAIKGERCSAGDGECCAVDEGEHCIVAEARAWDIAEAESWDVAEAEFCDVTKVEPGNVAEGELFIVAEGEQPKAETGIAAEATLADVSIRTAADKEAEFFIAADTKSCFGSVIKTANFLAAETESRAETVTTSRIEAKRESYIIAEIQSCVKRVTDSSTQEDPVSCAEIDVRADEENLSREERCMGSQGLEENQVLVIKGDVAEGTKCFGMEPCIRSESIAKSVRLLQSDNSSIDTESFIDSELSAESKSWFEAPLQQEILVGSEASVQLSSSNNDSATSPNINENAPATEIETLLEALHFATLAYYVEDEDCVREHLSDMGFSALSVSPAADKPGHLGYFIAVSDKILLISVKGTSCLEDIATDFCAQSVSYNPQKDCDCDVPAIQRVEVTINLSREDSVDDETGVIDNARGQERIHVEGGVSSAKELMSCHEGFLISAKRLVQNVYSYVKEWVIEKNYKLQMVGHSMGAAAVCLASTILQSRLPDLDHRPFHVYAFGTPPVFDYDSALASSSYITSIVNSSDVVTRSSLANFTILLEVLRKISDHLVAQSLAPTSPFSISAFLQKVIVKGRDDEHLLMTSEQLENAIESALNRVPLKHANHLYIPGRVLLLHRDNQVENQDTLVQTDEENPDEPDTTKATKNNRQFCTVTNGAASVLRLVDMDGYQMLGDHTTTSYQAALRALLPPNIKVRETTIIPPTSGSRWSK